MWISRGGGGGRVYLKMKKIQTFYLKPHKHTWLYKHFKKVCFLSAMQKLSSLLWTKIIATYDVNASQISTKLKNQNFYGCPILEVPKKINRLMGS